MIELRYIASIVVLSLCAHGAMARDDGGFNLGHGSGKAPAALGDNSAILATNDPHVADIEPAAGDDTKKNAPPSLKEIIGLSEGKTPTDKKMLNGQ